MELKVFREKQHRLIIAGFNEVQDILIHLDGLQLWAVLQSGHLGTHVPVGILHQLVLIPEDDGNGHLTLPRRDGGYETFSAARHLGVYLYKDP